MTYLRQLIELVRAEPVVGTVIGLDGSIVELTVDESVVAQIARNTDADMLNLEELPAAGRALARGDAAPLLRMAAETVTAFPPGVGGPPNEFGSAAATVAGYCSENPTPWNPQASADARRSQFAAAVAALPATAFGPFSVEGWTGDWLGRWQAGFSLVGAATEYRSGPCIDWPAPARTAPIVPAGATYPDVPVLVTGADTSVHTPTEESRAVAALFPSARYVEFVGGDHIPALVEPCVAAVMVRFIESLDPGDTRCAPDPGGPWYTPGDFPLRAANAVPARIDPTGRNQARVADRRIVAAAVAVLADAYYHGGKQWAPAGQGLRGGSYSFEFGEQSFTMFFDKDRFVSNVAVDGRMTIAYEDATFTATLRLSGAALRGRNAMLRVKGRVLSRRGRSLRRPRDDRRPPRRGPRRRVLARSRTQVGRRGRIAPPAHVGAALAPRWQPRAPSGHRSVDAAEEGNEMNEQTILRGDVGSVGELPRVGELFADYRLEEVIGRGGMSVVYRAENLRLGNQVALKLMAPELAGDQTFRERFERESRLAASINHPSIVPIHDAGEEAGLLYIVMRYVVGNDLSQLLRETGPPRRRALPRDHHPGGERAGCRSRASARTS